FMRKYIFRGQIFAFIIMFCGLGLAGFLAYYDKGVEAVCSAIVSIIIAASQFIGLKNIEKKTKNK
ncbi:MAG: hypothetical protein LBS73_03075, partial [Campylobacteraceae bacterium]|nr:hypothetical protein [Campylobacteraceae bacterium]